MNLFKSFRPIVACAAELRRIANALEYFATVDARANNRYFNAGKAKRWGKDESELMHSDDFSISERRKEDEETFLQRGKVAYSHEEDDE